MGDLEAVRQRMRHDWDWRAREDALFYVAFGRRGQTREEFLATGADVLHNLRSELRRFPPGTDFRRMTALEIGCGPGRLMLPLSETFGRIQGVDVSGEMIALAARNLQDVAHAEARQNSGADLNGFEDQSVDFCYSYAVFQHIPDKEVVWSYLREACRVLKTGGILKCQFNGLPQAASSEDGVVGWTHRAGVTPELRRTPVAEQPDTWHGVSFRAEELADFAAGHDLQLLAMDRFDTQYLWITARKRPPSAGRPAAPRNEARILRITATFTGDAVVAQSGRFAAATVWVQGLDDSADLNNLRVVVDGQRTAPCFIGKQVWNNPTQVNFYLPPGARSGVLPVELEICGEVISNRAALRVVPAAPLVPQLVSVSDAINLLSSASIESRAIKVRLEEVEMAGVEAIRSVFAAEIDGRTLRVAGIFCFDPLPRLYQIDLTVPEEVAPGAHRLTLRLGAKRFHPVDIVIPA